MADKAKTQQPIGYLTSYRRVLSDRGALTLLAVSFAWRLAPASAFVFFAEFIHITYDVPATQAGLFLLVFGAVGVVAARLSGRLTGIVGPRSVVIIGIIAVTTASLLIPLSTSALPLTVLAMVLWAAGSWFALPAMSVLVAAHSDRLRGTMLAFNSSAIFLAGVVGPLVGAAVVSVAGFSAAFLAAGVLGVAALGLAWAVLPRREPGEEVPAAAA